MSEIALLLKFRYCNAECGSYMKDKKIPGDHEKITTMRTRILSQIVQT